MSKRERSYLRCKHLQAQRAGLNQANFEEFGVKYGETTSQKDIVLRFLPVARVHWNFNLHKMNASEFILWHFY